MQVISQIIADINRPGDELAIITHNFEISSPAIKPSKEGTAIEEMLTTTSTADIMKQFAVARKKQLKSGPAKIIPL